MTRLASRPADRADEEALGDAEPPVLTVRDLTVHFKTKRGTVHAVSGMNFDLARGETLGIVGESGSGKSTTAKAVLGLIHEATGQIVFRDHNLLDVKPAQMRTLRPELQLIFQDPIASLNPRLTIEKSVEEGLRIWPDRVRDDLTSDVHAVMRSVGLNPGVVGQRKPTQMSGGQCQRVAIARALALHPELLVCDEAVSALDVSVQAQILNLLRKMKAEFGLTMLFISHDLGVVKNVSDRVMVMYLGAVCEIASTEEIFSTPRHPYTRLLLQSVPTVHDAERRAAPIPLNTVEPPSPLNPPSGCRFRTRCPLATDRCAEEVPVLRPLGDGAMVACHYAE